MGEVSVTQSESGVSEGFCDLGPVHRILKQWNVRGIGCQHHSVLKGEKLYCLVIGIFF